MTVKKVSIVTPCYNGASLIHRLLDSVLKQDYLSIEMIIVDDGSTDETEEVISNYVDRFSAKGYSLEYIYQSNSGQSEAINKALKLIQGEYLVWPDSDDFYTQSDAISVLVKELENSPNNTSLVRCYSNLLDEKKLTVIGELSAVNDNYFERELFEDCLFQSNGFWYVPGNYMAKVEVLRKVLPNMEIYTEKNAGQNWQLMLPLLYGYECQTIEKKLYSVLVRKTSHSRLKTQSYSGEIKKFSSYERTIIETLNSINMSSKLKSEYIRKINIKYRLIEFNLAFKYEEKDIANNAYKAMKLLNSKIKLVTVIKHYALKYKSLGFLIRGISNIRNLS